MVMIEDTVGKFSQGLQQLQAENYEQAAEAFTESIAAFPQFEPAYRLRSEAYRSLGLKQAANEDLEEVISITRARLQEAEQSLGGQSRQRANSKSPGASIGFPQTIVAALASVASQSPLILWTVVGSVVLIIAALVFLMLAGG